MGLAVSVGFLAWIAKEEPDELKRVRKYFKDINKFLKQNDEETYEEPEELPELDNRANCTGFSYSCLHHLRRFAAHATANPKWKPKPFPKNEHPTDDPVIIDEMSMLSSHLLCHSDCEGYYVPIEFGNPLFADNEKLIPGAMLGSSYGLMRELVAVAKYLKIKLRKGVLSDAEAERINKLARQKGPFNTEYLVWICLFEAARLSIEHKTAIVFH